MMTTCCDYWWLRRRGLRTSQPPTPPWPTSAPSWRLSCTACMKPSARCQAMSRACRTKHLLLNAVLNGCRTWSSGSCSWATSLGCKRPACRLCSNSRTRPSGRCCRRTMSHVAFHRQRCSPHQHRAVPDLPRSWTWPQPLRGICISWSALLVTLSSALLWHLSDHWFRTRLGNLKIVNSSTTLLLRPYDSTPAPSQASRMPMRLLRAKW
mmetsp:Transcript_135328/g.234647  ORF Transcript_135328/g.234647 Transcript_135328/m.234647 type:complete len:209 (+) Transcript_135328:2715-3341(+)